MDDFEARFERARPGEAVTYHTGYSLRGCKSRRSALRFYYDGLCDLVQKRVSCDGRFEYVAVKRENVCPPSYPLEWETMIFGKIRKRGEA